MKHAKYLIAGVLATLSLASQAAEVEVWNIVTENIKGTRHSEVSVTITSNYNYEQDYKWVMFTCTAFKDGRAIGHGRGKTMNVGRGETGYGSLWIKTNAGMFDHIACRVTSTISKAEARRKRQAEQKKSNEKRDRLIERLAEIRKELEVLEGKRRP